MQIDMRTSLFSLLFFLSWFSLVDNIDDHYASLIKENQGVSYCMFFFRFSWSHWWTEAFCSSYHRLTCTVLMVCCHVHIYTLYIHSSPYLSYLCCDSSMHWLSAYLLLKFIERRGRSDKGLQALFIFQEPRITARFSKYITPGLFSLLFTHTNRWVNKLGVGVIGSSTHAYKATQNKFSNKDHFAGE